MKTPRRGALVVVRWTDIEHLTGKWRSFEEVRREKPDVYVAAGWVIGWGRRRCRIAPVLAWDKSRAGVSCAYTFPRGAVLDWHLVVPR